MSKHMKSNQGFTLVEILVVMTIIAVLAAVIIPTAVGFIDRARMTRDRMMAADMTRILTMHTFDHALDRSDPHAMRQVITRFSEHGHDFKTHARNTGYFYIPSQHAVRALKFREAATTNFDLSDFSRLGLLSRAMHPVCAQTFDTMDIVMPEQLFGTDKLLLSTQGSKVAEIVYGLRHGYAHPVLVDHNETRLFQRLHAEQARLSWLLDHFHPQYTLYVSHAEWRTDAQHDDVIERILFAPGLSHVPAYKGLFGQLSASLDRIKLPDSVKTIAKDAFPEAVFGEKTIVSSGQLTYHEEAFGTDVNIEAHRLKSLSETDWYERLVDIDETIIIQQTEVEGTLAQQVILAALPQETRQTVTAYHWITKGRTAVLRVFTDQGLYAEISTVVEE